MKSLKSMNTILRASFFLAIVILLLPAAPAAAQQDVVTVGTATGSTIVDVPIYIRDVSGTPLGIDQPFGQRIQAYSLRLNYAPTSAVQSISINRAGITTPLTPTFETKPQSPGTIALLDTFDETTNLIPFTSNAAAPGDLVAHLTVTIAPGTPAGTIIALTLDPVLTELTNQAGSPVTAENFGNGRLALVNGQITVAAAAPAIPTLSEWALILLAITLAAVVIRMRM